VELQKVILYYGFTPVSDPVALKMWQKNLCESLNLKGRILISEHGINGTLGGNMSDLKNIFVRQKNIQDLKRLISNGLKELVMNSPA